MEEKRKTVDEQEKVILKFWKSKKIYDKSRKKNKI